jgi:hypothetical protein
MNLFLRKRLLSHGFHELDSGARRFITFVLCNVVGWQCVVSSFMILLARRIEMPPSLVGWLIAFNPMSMIIVLGTVGLINRVGPKRVMFVSWLTRNILVCAVFLIPWVTGHWGMPAGWYLLMGATLAFCVARAFGAGAWLPWLYEIVPSRQRGLFFSVESFVTQGISVVILLLQALLLAESTHISRYLFVYAIGISAGFLSLFAMLRIPGGKATCPTEQGADGWTSYKTALADGRFVLFLAIASLGYSCSAWFGSAWVMYMRDELAFSSGYIMSLTALGSMGVLLSIRAWGRYADHSGSAHAMSNALFGCSAVALSFLCLAPGTYGIKFLVIPGIAAYCIFAAAFHVASNGANLNLVRQQGRVGYTNAWALTTSMACALTPIAAGRVIDVFGLLGYRLCFGISGIGCVLCALACRWLLSEKKPEDLSLPALLNPALPMRTYARVMWITLGLHESNKVAPSATEE